MSSQNQSGFITSWLYPRLLQKVKDSREFIGLNLRLFPFKALPLKENYIHETKDFTNDPRIFGILTRDKKFTLSKKIERGDILLKRNIQGFMKLLLDNPDRAFLKTLLICEISDNFDIENLFLNLYVFNNLLSLRGILVTLTLDSFKINQERLHEFNRITGLPIYADCSEYFFQETFTFPPWVSLVYSSYYLENFPEIKERYLADTSCVVILKSLSDKLQEIPFDFTRDIYMSLLENPNSILLNATEDLSSMDLEVETWRPSEESFKTHFYTMFPGFQAHKGELTKEHIEKSVLYTGRAPGKEGLHLGHYFSYLQTVNLQKKYKLKVFFHIALFERGLDFTQEQIHEAIRGVLALGFNPLKTFFYVDTLSVKHTQVNRLMSLASKVTFNTLSNTFGFSQSTCMDSLIYPLIQINNCFIAREALASERVTVICGLDQDPYFRLARDLARKLKEPLPLILYNKTLLGPKGLKMSTSSKKLLLSSSNEEVEKFVKSLPSSGGRTLKEHQEQGGQRNCQLLQLVKMIYLEQRYLKTEEKYLSGALTSKELRNELVFEIQRILREYQENLTQSADIKIKIL